MKDDDIDLSDIPEITDKIFAEAVLRSGGKKVSKRKLRVNILLDADIVAYFKAASGGKGYQTLINETLRNFISQDDMEKMLRQVIREELAEYRTNADKKQHPD